jgi:hypothetical protein
MHLACGSPGFCFCLGKSLTKELLLPLPLSALEFESCYVRLFFYL